jgi:NAD(P)-dependent dehydrogenase (short-subunit alcohol dehydrogenase family)
LSNETATVPSPCRRQGRRGDSAVRPAGHANGPSRAATDALSHIMAADLAGTGIDVNLLLPGGATRTGMTPCQGRTTCPLPTTVTPPLDTTKPRAQSRSLSTPTMAPSWTTTFLSRMAFSTTA